jgi:hypothetical protein
MDGVSFDTMTRQSTGKSSGRISLFDLGTAEVRAVVAGFHTVRAKKKHGKKKHKNNNQTQIQPAPQECPPVPTDLCIGQAQPCTDLFTVICGGDPTCQDLIACCSHFETCDFGGFVTCQLAATGN